MSRASLPVCGYAGLACAMAVAGAAAGPDDIYVGQWHGRDVRSVAFGPEGRYLANACDDDTVKLWFAATGRLARVFRGHTRDVNSVAISAGARLLASASDDDTARLWDAATAREVHRLSGHGGTVRAVAFSPDGHLLASGGDDDTVRIWDVAAGAQLRAIRAHRRDVRAVAFSPDGRLLATGSDDDRVKLWDVATGRAVKARMRHDDHVLCVSFSPDRVRLASASSDGTVKLWDAASGRQIQTLVGHRDEVRSVSFGPRGKLIATAGDDNTVRLWDAATGRHLRTLTAHSSRVFSVAFAANGQLLASASGDGTVKLWKPGDGSLLASLAPVGGENDYIAWTPERYFVATPAAEAIVTVQVGGRTALLSQYRHLFYRPDLVAARLAQRQPARQTGPEVALPPTAQIVMPDRDVTVTTDTIRVAAEAHDEKHRIADIVLTINGSVHRGFGGLTKPAAAGKQQEWSVRLAPGENRLAVYARSSAGVRSAEARRLVTYHAPTSTAVLKPRLWFLGVAVSSYKTPAYDLQYPVSDVKRLLECLNSQKGRLFEDVHAKLLLDEHTTREEISDARETFLSRASVRDMAVIFLAGHGVRGRRGGFYFLTHDADAERPHRRGYSWSDVQNQLIDGLAPQKVVLLVDTCHAGGVTKETATYRGIDPQQGAELELLADRLKEATGCYLFMAAKSDEKAAEAKRWGGGAFATALIEALEGRAAKDGVVTILTLLDYVDRRVIELTAGAQHPTWSVPHNAGNFPIAAVGR